MSAFLFLLPATQTSCRGHRHGIAPHPGIEETEDPMLRLSRPAAQHSGLVLSLDLGAPPPAGTHFQRLPLRFHDTTTDPKARQLSISAANPIASRKVYLLARLISKVRQNRVAPPDRPPPLR